MFLDEVETEAGRVDQIARVLEDGHSSQNQQLDRLLKEGYCWRRDPNVDEWSLANADLHFVEGTECVKVGGRGCGRDSGCT
jgi:hypothetical protein